MGRMRLTLFGALCATMMGAASVGTAQIPTKIKQKVKQEAQKKENEIANAAVKCVFADSACVAKAKASGKPVVVTDSSGKTLSKAQQDSLAQQRQQAQGQQQQQQQQQKQQAPQATQQQARPGEGAWANYDFVPGERVLFVEDFTKDRVGNFPKRFELLNGNMEIVEWEAKRWLRVSTTGAFKVVLPENLPDRFTVEFDVTIPWGQLAIYTSEPTAEGPPGSLRDRAMIMVSQFFKAGVIGPDRKPMALVYPKDALPDSVFIKSYEVTRPVRVRVHADGKYVKVYLEEHRVANVPNAELVRTNQLVFHFGLGPGNKSYPLITNISINAGGREMYDALVADGRVVTQGILFDTGSDRLRAESTPTLREIGAMLESHPELRVRIEGHTDAVGDDASNLQLSERRAAAVREFLVTTYKIDAARLESRGFGESKPLGSNDSAEGRQQNRRVELVKM